ncbi:MAG: UbiA prenyltransferase family protein [Armatimonadetes bacterium]|nr:UbiA prenyltransferase family protein [Armatimonadota bacterium]
MEAAPEGAGRSAAQPKRSLVVALLIALRPHQWVKNVLVFGGLAFTGRWHELTSGVASRRPEEGHAVAAAVAAFVIFCALSSAGYLINDLRDRESDACHPTKCRRPIAAGEVSQALAIITAILLFAGALVWSVLLSRRGGDTQAFLWTAVGYAVLTNAYSFYLKNLVIIDVLSLALLFVLRVVAGCWVIPEPPSAWIVVCTLFGALFMGLCKRRGELLQAGAKGVSRAVLAKYHTDEAHEALLLDQMIQMSGTATILCYSLYTFYRPIEIHATAEQGRLMFTIPFVVYGVFRYLYLVHKADIGQNPERLFADRGMVINMILWAATIVFLTRGRNG